MLCDMGAEFRRVEFAPGAPTGFRRQRAFLGRDQIPVDRTPGQGKMPGGRYFGATTLDEFYDPFPQVQRIGFHARKPISQCPNINMKCYRQKFLNHPGAFWIFYPLRLTEPRSGGNVSTRLKFLCKECLTHDKDALHWFRYE